MIRPSRIGDEAGLKTLWQVAFGDSIEQIDAFFDSLYQPGMAIVWDAEGTIASALYLLDAGTTPTSGGGSLSTSYSYALATLPAYRGQGIGSQVTRATIAHSFDLGFDCNVICPAEESLFPYYMGLGYTVTLPIAETTVLRAEFTTSAIIHKIMSTDFSSYSQLRSAYLQAGSTIYTEDYFRYLAQVCEALDGELYRLELEDSTALCAVSRSDDRLFIREFLPASHVACGTQALLQHFDLSTAIVRTVATEPLQQRPFALVAYAGEKRLPLETGYFPFVLD